MADIYKYPRRRLMRGFIHRLSKMVFGMLTDFRVIGAENFPTTGPLLVVSNHFSFIDPVALVRIVPWPMEFLGGFRTPNAPMGVASLRELWGYYPVFRGTGSQVAFRASDAIMGQSGVMGLFPEGTSAAAALRPARPGMAFMAVRSGACVLPIGLDGLMDVFPKLRRGKRAQVTAHIGKPMGPFEAPGRGRKRRQLIDDIGHEIMRKIADLIPPQRRGFYSADPALRAEAEAAAYYPFDDEPEG